MVLKFFLSCRDNLSHGNRDQRDSRFSIFFYYFHFSFSISSRFNFTLHSSKKSESFFSLFTSRTSKTHSRWSLLLPRHALPPLSGRDGLPQEDFRWMQLNAKRIRYLYFLFPLPLPPSQWLSVMRTPRLFPQAPCPSSTMTDRLLMQKSDTSSCLKLMFAKCFWNWFMSVSQNYVLGQIILTLFWLHSCYILATFCLCFGYFLATFWLHFGCILGTFWLHFGYILAIFWLCFG